MNEHGGEPVRGLPEPLPDGETLLWQGAPQWSALVRRGFHLRALAIYFAILIAWYVATVATAGAEWREAALGIARVAGLAMAALGLVAAFAWLVCRTTVYTITDRRLVMRIGVAFPMTLNLPFRSIESAGLRGFPAGAGDIPVSMLPECKIAYLYLWPHARPWRMSRPQPMLRAVPDAARVAQVLARGLAASAEQPARPVAETVAGAGPRVRATAVA